MLALVVCLGLLTAVNIGLLGYYKYFAETKPLTALQEELKQAAAQDAVVTKTLEVFSVAEKENRPLLQIVKIIAEKKPDTVKFTSLTINETVGENGLRIEGYGKDASIFHQYTELLAGEAEMMKAVQIDRIFTSSGDYKNFSMKANTLR